MMDQQNFEAPRPVSADPAVALAEALGQLPKAPGVKSKTANGTSVESLAQELGLKLGDQNELTIRRIKRGKNLFVRPRQRHADPACRHHQAPQFDGGAAGL